MECNGIRGRPPPRLVPEFRFATSGLRHQCLPEQFARSIAEAYPFHRAIRDLYARERAVKRHEVDNAPQSTTKS